jgi:hypothetical protein
LRRVLAYPKLARVIAGASELADLVEASSVVVLPSRVFAVVEDESNNRSRGSGRLRGLRDEHLLGLGAFKDVPVMSPAEFVAVVVGG